MGYVLGLDVGSGSMKGIVMNDVGTIIKETSVHYSMNTPKPGYSEQDPKQWIDACQKILTVLCETVSDFSESLEAISFSGQMHSLVVLDEKDEPIYPAILWNDVRTTLQCEKIRKTSHVNLLEITKNRVLEGFTLPKILWLQEMEPEVWSRVRTIMLPKDYVSFFLTGQKYTEYSDASGTLLMDVEKHQWSKEILETFHISEDILPKLVSSMDEVGKLRLEISQQFHFKKEVKIFAGGADNVCAALGAGITQDEIGLVSIGTSGVFSAFEKNTKNYEGQLHFFNHVIPNYYYAMGVTLSAGNSLNWFKETFAKDRSFDELLEETNKVPIGCDGLLFTPYIVGERTPHFDSQIRGSFIGIDTRHRLPYFTKAVMEGIVFSLKESKEILEKEKKIMFKQVVSVGGGAKNKEWLQMQADIFNADIICLNSEQGPGVGACLIAALGCGWFDSIERAVKSGITYKPEKISPISKNYFAYDKVYRKWKNIYQATKNINTTV